MKNFKNVALMAALVCGVALAGCEGSGQSAYSKAEHSMKEAQQDIMSRANAQIPVPKISNFLSRENLSKWLQRMDNPAKVWYVYIYPKMGTTPIGYYVSSTYPQSTATFMTPPEEVKIHRDNTDSMVTVTAPALDGVYYGKGAGDSTYFFFDANTDAFIQVTDFAIFASDVKLDLGKDVKQIKPESSTRVSQ